MQDALNEIGIADAVIARDTEKGLELIDGHLRREVLGNSTESVPVLIVDLNDEEADKLLLTLDPLAMMAHTDQDVLLNLLENTAFEATSINEMLEALVNGERQPMPDLFVELTGLVDRQRVC